jgi:hypothetical protein
MNWQKNYIGDKMILLNKLPIELTNNLKNELLEKEKFILTLPPDNNIGKLFNNDNVTTMRSAYHNIFKWKTQNTKLLLKYIKNGFELYCKNNPNFNIPKEKCYYQCWVNIWRDKQYIKPHTHASNDLKQFKLLSGHIFLNGKNPTATWYVNENEDYKNKNKSILNMDEYLKNWKHLLNPIKNELGKIILFPGNIIHFTKPYNQLDENDFRMTCAFDIVNIDMYDNIYYNKPLSLLKLYS